MIEKFKILNNIDNPDDLKRLSFKDLNLLSTEIYEYIHEVISDKGGHYSSPLGVVDLTIALHYAYNTPSDKLIWDVGHQAYAHKILTERKKEFENIRQLNGISGFLKIDESKYDSFGAGHSSTSISAALGFAHARDMNKEKNQVVAIIGDGALTGGMAYEGLNNLGYHRTQLTVILNDNSFSISKSVGALSKYLTRITTNPTYNKLRNEIWNISGKIPVVSEQVQSFLRKTEGTVKSYLTPGILFEELGLRYIGPIDGHDIEGMIEVFKSVQSMNTPVLLHVFTDKSKGHSLSKHDAVKSYSISKSKKNQNSKNISFSNTLGKVLFLLSDNYKFHCVTAAMEIGTGLKSFVEKNPNRYIDVGIAEEHAITYSAGLSASGILPIITIYSTFMQRAYDQIIHDVALQKLPAIFCMDRAGVVGNDGPTHHGIFDVSFMRSIPNMIVTAPMNGNEMYNLMYTAIKNKLILSIRYPKQLTSFDENLPLEELDVGSWSILNKGKSICILTFGSMINTCIKVVDLQKKENNRNITLVNCRFIKPLDSNLLDKLVLNHDLFVVVEEGVLSGGFGSAILEYFSLNSIVKKVKLIGINDEFSSQGTRSELLDMLGLNSSSINLFINKEYNE